jgi:hypothetical protein
MPEDTLIRAARRRARSRRDGRSRPSRILGTRTRAALLVLASLGAIGLAGWRTITPGPVAPSAAPVTLSPARDPAGPVGAEGARAPGAERPASQAPAGQDQAEERAGTADARWRAGRPAYQSLPWRGDGVLIDIIGATAAGKVILAVAYTSTKAHARRGYRRFLALHHDSGAGYIARYLPWGAYRRARCPELDECPIAPRY